MIVYKKHFKNVNWNQVNQEYKRDYAKAAVAVMENKGIDHQKSSRHRNNAESFLII